MKPKKIMAMILAAAMVLGSSMTAFAADTAATPSNAGGATGTGTSFEHVDKEVITVTLPTSAEVANVFNYYVDPERAINSAGQLTDGSAVTANDDGVYFANAGTAAVPDKNAAVTAFSINGKDESDTSITVTVPANTTVTKVTYSAIDNEWQDDEGNGITGVNVTGATAQNGDTITIDPYVAGTSGSTTTFSSSSEAVRFEGKNSVDVDVSVVATVTAASDKDITLVADAAALTAATSPALLMTLKVGSDTKAITSGGATATATITGKPNNFAVTVENGKFVYGVRTNTDTANGGTALEAWDATTVQLIGKTNQKDIPAGADAMTAPTINLTWTVAKHGAASEGDTSATPASAVTNSGETDILVRLVSGQSAAASKITSVKVNGTDVAAAKIAVSGSGNVWLKGVVSGAGTYKVLITYDGTTYSATYVKK